MRGCSVRPVKLILRQKNEITEIMPENWDTLLKCEAYFSNNARNLKIVDEVVAVLFLKLSDRGFDITLTLSLTLSLDQ